MFIDSFAHRALMALGLSALVIVAVFAAYVGLLGAATQDILQRLWSPISEFYQSNKTATELTLAALGLMVSAASATFAVFKSWHYAELNLPKRIEAFIHERRAGFQNNRPALVNAIRASSPTDNFLSPSLTTLRLNAALNAVGLPSEMRTAQTLANSAKAISNQISVLDARRTELASEASTAHVLKGLHFTNEAHSRTDVSSKRVYHECALGEFEKALERQPDDLDALELAASQCAIMGKEPAALEYYRRLNNTAKVENRKTVQARAMRLSASILESQPAPKSWDDARGELEAAISILRLDQGAGQEFNPKVELAECFLLLGEVQTKRERYSAARKALNGAKLSSAALSPSQQTEIQNRIEEAINRLNLAAKDPEKPDNGGNEGRSEPPQPTEATADRKDDGTSS